MVLLVMQFLALRCVQSYDAYQRSYKDVLMSETKQNRFSSLLAEEHGSHGAADSAVVDAPPQSAPKQGGQEVGSWDAYRNWLTKVQAPEQKRSLPDPALFSFKGYRSWAEKIRRDWDSEE